MKRGFILGSFLMFALLAGCITSGDGLSTEGANAPAPGETPGSPDIPGTTAPAPAISPSATLSSEVIAESGSARDIQLAARAVAAAGGGTVYIPEGDFQLDGSVRIRDNVRLVGAGAEKTILRTTGSSMVIRARGNNIRISGFSLISTDYKGGNGIEIEDAVDFRIDHLYIEGYSNQAAIMVSGIDTRGVIDHNVIKVSHDSDLGYGVAVYRDDYWEEDMPLGTEQAVFIEDNTFINPRHAVAANAGAHYVFRHNVVKQGTIAHAVDAHGPYWGSKEGTRAVEVYNNVIEDPVPDGSERAIGIRGGGGVIFNNTIKGYAYAVMLFMEDRQNLNSYPAYHQVRDLYIWNNSNDGAGEVIVENKRKAVEFIQENHDFFRYPKPGYVPYTYPHPLTLEPDKGKPGAVILNPIGDKAVAVGEQLEFTVSAIAPDAGQPVFSASNLPPGAVFDQASGIFSWKPGVEQAGTFSGVHFEATEGTSTASEDISITVSLPVPLPLRINSGGEEYIDTRGNAWQTDRRYTKGGWGFYGEDLTVARGARAISGTEDDPIYQTERWGLSGYLFNLPDGTYTLVLHFAETYTPGIGRRVFDVTVQGNLALERLDIFSEAGMDAALTKTISNVTVSDGLLDIAITYNINSSVINGVEILPAMKY